MKTPFKYVSILSTSTVFLLCLLYFTVLNKTSKETASQWNQQKLYIRKSDELQAILKGIRRNLEVLNESLTDIRSKQQNITALIVPELRKNLNKSLQRAFLRFQMNMWKEWNKQKLHSGNKLGSISDTQKLQKNIANSANILQTFLESKEKTVSSSSKFSKIRVPSLIPTCHPLQMHGKSAWFDNHFVSQISPILTKHNIKDLVSSFSWWRGLQKNVKNLTETLSIIESLFKLIPNDEKPFRKHAKNICIRCALVGNSDNIKGSAYGSFIDQHSFVFRMNTAPVRGYEADVGSVTTHRFMYPESAMNLPKSVSLIFVPYKMLDFEWLISALTDGHVIWTYTLVMRLLKTNHDKVLIYSPYFLKYVWKIWMDEHGYYPSTGFAATIFVLHVCDKVNLFGFGQSKDGSWGHYWENSSYADAWRKSKVHDGDYEAKVLLQLQNEGKISVYTGNGSIEPKGPSTIRAV